MLILGHRGAPERFRENTIESLLAAVDAGADGVELDVRVTTDDHLLLRHDDELDAERRLTAMTAREVLEAEPWTPTLADALAALSGARRVVVEVKPDPDRTERVAELVAGALAAAAHPGAMVSSFDRTMVNRLRRLLPQLRTGQLVGRMSRDLREVIECAADEGHQEVHLYRSYLTGEVGDGAFAAAASRDVQVVAWTVNELDEARDLRGRGLHAVITDKPHEFVQGLR